MSFDTIVFKFATYGIIICSFLLVCVEFFTVTNKSVATDKDVFNILIRIFFVIKSIANTFLMIVCAFCRTRFDLTEVPAIFERFLVSHVFLTIFSFVIKIYFFGELTDPYKDMLNYELLFTGVSFGLSIVAYSTWTPYKATHISKLRPEQTHTNNNRRYNY